MRALILLLLVLLLVVVVQYAYAAFPSSGRYAGVASGACTNSLDFSQACNSQYLGLL